ncbi:MAG: GNAT family N-acetyltransferase [Desulfobacteraceae bacterium]|jgi:ribosomal protein S18 acetylase RimI-like enzyme
MKTLPILDVSIRRLRRGDADDVSRIFKAVRVKPGEVDVHRIIEEQVEKPVDASFVAEFGGRIVGYMISYVTSGNFGVDRCAWISMFGVEPEFRGQGIGKRLAEEIFKFHKDNGIEEVFTSVRWDFTDILSFFKILGFERSEFLHLRKHLK